MEKGTFAGILAGLLLVLFFPVLALGQLETGVDLYTDTYFNLEYGFKISLPRSLAPWDIIDDKEEIEDFAGEESAKDILVLFDGYLGEYLYVQAQELDGAMSLPEFVQEASDAFKEWEEEERENIQLANVGAVKIIYLTGYGKIPVFNDEIPLRVVNYLTVNGKCGYVIVGLTSLFDGQFRVEKYDTLAKTFTLLGEVKSLTSQGKLATTWGSQKGRL